MPERAKEARKTVKQMQQVDVLGLKQPEWNPSVQTTLTRANRPLASQILRFTGPRKDYDFRAQAIEKDDFVPVVKSGKLKLSETEILGSSHPILSVKAEKKVVPSIKHDRSWNPETTYSNREIRDKDQQEKQKAQENSRKMNATLEGRPTLMQREEDWMQTLKEGSEERNKMGMTQKQYDEFIALRNVENEIKKIQVSKRKALRTIRQTRTPDEEGKEVRWEHTGVWEYSELEGCEVWSCCMNTERDSRGCSKTVTEKSRWKFENELDSY